MLIERICKVCQKRFFASESKIADGYARYCSRKCMGEDRKKQVTIACAFCGKKFGVPLSAVKNGRKYCSRDCMRRSPEHKLIISMVQDKGKKITRNCDFCGIEFFTYAHRSKRGHGKYCSRECMYASPERKMKLSANHADHRGANNPNFGKHHSDDAREKISAANKGKIISQKVRDATSARMKGNTYSLGVIRSPESIEKTRKANIGRKRTPESVEKIASKLRGRKKSPEHNKHNSESHKGKIPWNKGKHGIYSDDVIERWSILRRGPGTHWWKGGISTENRKRYCRAFNNFMRERTREAFGRVCYLCAMTEKENGKKLSVHHVDYNKSQGCKGMKWSLIPLCRKCHANTNHHRWFWFALLRDYWINSYLDINPTFDVTL